MSINIQTSGGLREVGKVTKKKILKALGFTPADVQDLFSGDFNDLENNPILASEEDTEFSIVDKDGNIILKVDAEGVHTTDVYLKDAGKIKVISIDEDISDALYVVDNDGNKIASIDSSGIHSVALSYKDNANGDAIDVQAKIGTLASKSELPDISNDENNTLYIVDNNNNIVARIDSLGLHTTDIYLDNLGRIRDFIGNVSYNDGTEGLAYRELDDGTLACTGIGTAGTATNIQIASIINGKPVTSIIGGAFYNCDFTHVVIPDSVTSIGIQAFQFCGNLTSVVIGDGVTSIGQSAFHSCVKLESVAMGRGVTSIGDAAFGNCKKLTNVVIPNGVKSLSPAAFSGCSSLTSVVIPDGVTSIDYSAFENCSGLKSVVIPDSVISIGYNAFKNCSSLTSIVIPDSVASIDGGSLSYGILNGCSKLESITIPFVGNRAGVTSEDTNQYPFGYIFGKKKYTGGTETAQSYYGSSTDTLTSTTYYIPTSLKKVTVTGGNILRGAFYNCSSLTSIEIPNGVTEIGEWAFAYCGLTSISIPNSVTSIGASAFCWCGNLKSVVIPDGVTSIGKSAFAYCGSLESITIPFVGATKDGTDNTHFGYIFGADSYSDNATYVPTLLKEVMITGGTSINGSTFSGCRNLASVVIPDSVTSIGGYTFENCSGLKSVVIGNSVTSIFGYAFFGCSGLKSVDIPDSVTLISDYAFYNCSNLKIINIPHSVTSIKGGILKNSAVEIIKYDGPVSGFQALGTTSSILNGAPSTAFVYCLDGKIAQNGTVTNY